MTKMIAEEDNQTKQSATAQTGSVVSIQNGRLAASCSRQIDDKLANAAVKALQDGCLMPIIKEELRLTIQSKRLKKGQDELLVTFQEPTAEQLTGDELQQRRRRRENNKLAAQKCRAKRRERADALEREAAVLESQNNKLRDQILALERERNRLHEIVSDHATCGSACASDLAPDSPEVMDLTH